MWESEPESGQVYFVWGVRSKHPGEQRILMTEGDAERAWGEQYANLGFFRLAQGLRGQDPLLARVGYETPRTAGPDPSAPHTPSTPAPQRAAPHPARGHWILQQFGRRQITES